MINQQSQGLGSPISNEAYNLLSALQSKLEGLEAYRKYAGDGHDELWKQLTSLDTQEVQMLAQELERVVQSGGLRSGQQLPGTTTDNVRTIPPA